MSSMQCTTAQLSSVARPELSSDGYTYPLKGRSLTIAAGLSSHKRLQCLKGLSKPYNSKCCTYRVLIVCFAACCSIEDGTPGRPCFSLSRTSQSLGAGLSTCKGNMSSDLHDSAS